MIIEPRYVTSPLTKSSRKSRDVRSGETSMRTRDHQCRGDDDADSLTSEVWQGQPLGSALPTGYAYSCSDAG